MSSAACVVCRHAIDDAARVCPYCGSDPRTGEKLVDAQAILQEVFHPRRVTATQGLMEFARQRPGLVIALGVLAVVPLLPRFHGFVRRRNATLVSVAAAGARTE